MIALFQHISYSGKNNLQMIIITADKNPAHRFDMLMPIMHPLP